MSKSKRDRKQDKKPAPKRDRKPPLGSQKNPWRPTKPSRGVPQQPDL